MPVTMAGPSGAKVSEPLARHHCKSLPGPCCQLRSLTSLPQVTPKIASRASSTEAFFACFADHDDDFAFVMEIGGVAGNHDGAAGILQRGTGL